MSGVTRSGQIFAAPNPLVWSKDMKGKAKVGTKKSDKASLILKEEILAGRFAKGEEDFSRKKICVEEAN